MNEHPYTRTEMLIGRQALDVLKQASVIVFGVGGVGGYVVEVLARSGIGGIAIVDNDTVNISNINRQIIATHSTIGRNKVDVARERILDINPDCQVQTFKMFYLPENAEKITLTDYDYVVDCIDTMAAKIELIRRCHQCQVPIISSMGAANKMDPAGFSVADLSKTSMDPLAKIMRKRLRKMGITHLKVVYSKEVPLTPLGDESQEAFETAHKVKETDQIMRPTKRKTPASNAFVPPAAGLVAGGEVIRDLIRGAGLWRDSE